MTGLLVPPGDQAALAAACVRLLDDDDLCARLGTAGRQRAETRYAWPRLLDEHIEILRALPEPGPGGRARRSARGVTSGP